VGSVVGSGGLWGLWWALVVCGGFWWSVGSVVGSGGLWWALVVCGGFWWSVGSVMVYEDLPADLQGVDTVAALDLILARVGGRVDCHIVFVPCSGNQRNAQQTDRQTQDRRKTDTQTDT